MSKKEKLSPFLLIMFGLTWILLSIAVPWTIMIIEMLKKPNPFVYITVAMSIATFVAGIIACTIGAVRSAK